MTLSLPPLFRDQPALDPTAAAIAAAREGTDPGLITHDIRPDRLRAALVLAPEAPLEDAAQMLLVAGNGFADAFGALAPSEVGCHFDWPGTIRIEGGKVGRLAAAASTANPKVEPDWLVISLDIQIFAPADHDPGDTPDQTTLWDEGCADVAPQDLLEAWSRHTLVHINDWLEDGPAKTFRDWSARLWKPEEETTIRLPGETLTGTPSGLDEKGGLILKQADAVRIVPLTAAVETA